MFERLHGAGRTMERAMASWSEFHTDPRKSYYLFLRQEYQHPACVAHACVKRIDRMIAELAAPSRASVCAGFAASLSRRVEMLARRLWGQMHYGRWTLGRGIH
jgi:hypothetical protein